MVKNIFVVGLDEFNLERLNSIRNADHYKFHSLLQLDKVKSPGYFPIEDELERAANELRSFDGSIDAIIGFWDFPVSLMVPILAHQFGAASPPLRSVVKCEHKYWSRREQHDVIPDQIPDFTALDPFAENPRSQISLDFPFWLKPIKAFASRLGFKIDDEDKLQDAIRKIRDDIDQFADPFNYVLSLVDLPEEIRGIDGYHCVAEQIMDGHQCTVAGYVYEGKVQTYGLISSINYPHSTSFYRYQYPSILPDHVVERTSALAEKVMAHMGFDNSPFNVEFFYHEETDHLWLLEINTRISQSHSYLFEQVDGASNHQILVELALGNRPEFPRREGSHNCAAKFHIRAFNGEQVTAAPDEKQLTKLREELPAAIVLPQVEPGMPLADAPSQDSYSALLAVVYLAAENEDALLDQYRRCLQLLDYQVDHNPVHIPV